MTAAGSGATRRDERDDAPDTVPQPDAVLGARGLSAGYGAGAVVRDLDVDVRAGEVVTLLGPNGAGKTTTLLALTGALPAMAGTTFWRGLPCTKPLHVRARSGLSFVTEERSVFRSLSVRDNLRVAGVGVDAALELFPELESRLRMSAGLLSGGEQQMLTLARALSRRPEALVADELSLGLAPLVVQRLLDAVRRAADGGVAVLLVEQHVSQALTVADRAIVLQRGRVALEGQADSLRGRLADIEASYLTGPVPA